MPQFPLPETGADKRAGAFWRAAGDGAWSSGTPQPPPLRKACGGAQHKGLARVLPPGAGAARVPRQGVRGHVRAGQTEQERAQGQETAPWQEKVAGLPSAGRLGTPHKAASVQALALPTPLGNGTGWLSRAGWQPGQGPPPPHTILGGRGPPRLSEGLHLRAAGRCHPAQGEGWLGCGTVPGSSLLPHHPHVRGPRGVSRGCASLCADQWPRGPAESSHGTAGAAICRGQQPPQACRGRMPRQGMGASTSGLLSRCPACPCPSRPLRRPGRVIPGHAPATSSAGGVSP